MKNVIIYTTDYCPYCVRAKNLLKQNNIEFEEINLEGNSEKLTELKNRTGMRTVPQIFIGDQLIGGFTELNELSKTDNLIKLLNS